MLPSIYSDKLYTFDLSEFDKEAIIHSIENEFDLSIDFSNPEKVVFSTIDDHKHGFKKPDFRCGWVGLWCCSPTFSNIGSVLNEFGLDITKGETNNLLHFLAKKYQEKTDMQQIQAGAKMGAALLDMAKIKGINSKEEMQNIEKQVQTLMLPLRYKDISAETLKEMLVEKYIEEASITMMKAFKEREVLFQINKKDEDLLPILKEKWKQRGILYKECVACEDHKLEDEKKGTVSFFLNW